MKDLSILHKDMETCLKLWNAFWGSWETGLHVGKGHAWCVIHNNNKTKSLTVHYDHCVRTESKEKDSEVLGTETLKQFGYK